MSSCSSTLEQSTSCQTTDLGPSPVPATGGPAGCWMQVLQDASARSGCIKQLTLRLASGFDASSTSYELRVYESSGAPGTAPVDLTMKAKRSLSVNAALAGSEQVVELSQCLYVREGESVGLASLSGRLGDTVAPNSNSQRAYWNIFQATSTGVGSVQTMSSQVCLTVCWWCCVWARGQSRL